SFPAHDRRFHARRLGVASAVVWIYAQEHASLTARSYSYVSFDEKREPAEHALLGDASFGRQQLANALHQNFVISHRMSSSRGQHGSAHFAQYGTEHKRSALRGLSQRYAKSKRNLRSPLTR